MNSKTCDGKNYKMVSGTEIGRTLVLGQLNFAMHFFALFYYYFNITNLFIMCTLDKQGDSFV